MFRKYAFTMRAITCKATVAICSLVTLLISTALAMSYAPSGVTLHRNSLRQLHFDAEKRNDWQKIIPLDSLIWAHSIPDDNLERSRTWFLHAGSMRAVTIGLNHGLVKLTVSNGQPAPLSAAGTDQILTDFKNFGFRFQSRKCQYPTGDCGVNVANLTPEARVRVYALRKVIHVQAPLLLPLLLFAWFPSHFLLIRPLKRYYLSRKGLCVECQYDLRGNSNARCPECGTIVRE